MKGETRYCAPHAYAFDPRRGRSVCLYCGEPKPVRGVVTDRPPGVNFSAQPVGAPALVSLSHWGIH